MAMTTRTLPFTWQDIYDWYISRHHQPAEAYTSADKLWSTLAPHILDEMDDGEVEQFAAALCTEHGTFVGRPDITSRVFPRCLDARLDQIATQKKFVGQHQGPQYRVVDVQNMVALHVVDNTDTMFGMWRWEIIHGHLLDNSGYKETEAAAWAAAEDQWRISRPRLTQKGTVAP